MPTSPGSPRCSTAGSARCTRRSTRASSRGATTSSTCGSSPRTGSNPSTSWCRRSTRLRRHSPAAQMTTPLSKTSTSAVRRSSVRLPRTATRSRWWCHRRSIRRCLTRCASTAACRARPVTASPPRRSRTSRRTTRRWPRGCVTTPAPMRCLLSSPSVAGGCTSSATARTRTSRARSTPSRGHRVGRRTLGRCRGRRCRSPTGSTSTPRAP